MSEDTEADVAVMSADGSTEDTEEVVIELDRRTDDHDLPDRRHPAADRALSRIAGAVLVRDRFLRNVYGAHREGQCPDGEQRRARG